MQDQLVEWFGSTGGGRAVIIALVVVVVLFCWFVLPRMWNAMMGGTALRAIRNRQPRLAVMDVAAVDNRRRLVLIRRDNVEHLILIGGPSDLVVEQTIIKGVPVGTTAGRMPRPPQAFDVPPPGERGQPADERRTDASPETVAAVRPLRPAEPRPAETRPAAEAPRPAETRAPRAPEAFEVPKPMEATLPPVAAADPRPEPARRPVVRPAPPLQSAPSHPPVGAAEPAPPAAVNRPYVPPAPSRPVARPEPISTPPIVAEPVVAAVPPPAAAEPKGELKAETKAVGVSFDDLAARLDEALRLDAEPARGPAAPAGTAPAAPRPPVAPAAYPRPTRGPAAFATPPAPTPPAPAAVPAPAPVAKPAVAAAPAPSPAPVEAPEPKSVLGPAAAWFRPRATAPEKTEAAVEPPAPAPVAVVPSPAPPAPVAVAPEKPAAPERPAPVSVVPAGLALGGAAAAAAPAVAAAPEPVALAPEDLGLKPVEDRDDDAPSFPVVEPEVLSRTDGPVAAVLPAVAPAPAPRDDIGAALAEDLARILVVDPIDEEPAAGAGPAVAANRAEPPVEVAPPVVIDLPPPDAGKRDDFLSLEDEMARLLDELAGDGNRSSGRS